MIPALFAFAVSCGNANEQQSGLLDGSTMPTYSMSHIGNQTPYGSVRAQVLVNNSGKDRPYAEAVAGQALGFWYYKAGREFGTTGDVDEVKVFLKTAAGQIVTSDLRMLPGMSRPYSFSGEILIPADQHGVLDYWFEATLSTGEKKWDSRFGANYQVNVASSETTTLEFLAPGNNQQWPTPAPQGALRAGTTLELKYAAERMTLSGVDEGWYRMGPTRSIFAGVSFKNANGGVISTVEYHLGVNGLLTRLVAIPNDAKEVTIWFMGNNVSRRGYDSNFGQNWTFAIQ
jgi:hypothetical protein